jgi:hypothetical protein
LEFILFARLRKIALYIITCKTDAICMTTRPVLAAQAKTDAVSNVLPADIGAIAITPEIMKAIDCLPASEGVPEAYSVGALRDSAAANNLTMDLLAQVLKAGLGATWGGEGKYPDWKVRLQYAIATLQAFGVAPMPGRSQAFVQINNNPVIRDERAVERVADIARRLISVNK